MTATHTVYIYTASPRTPDFEFDVTTETTKDAQYKIPTHPVENTGTVGDHIYKLPWKLNTNGLVAVTPITPRVHQPTPADDPAVLGDMQKALEELADKTDLVTVVSDLYTGPAAITSLRVAKSVQDGQSVRIDIGLEEFKIGQTGSAQIDPSRLKRKVSRRQKKKGGKLATEQALADQLRANLGIKQSKFSSATGG